LIINPYETPSEIGDELENAKQIVHRPWTVTLASILLVVSLLPGTYIGWREDNELFSTQFGPYFFPVVVFIAVLVWSVFGYFIFRGVSWLKNLVCILVALVFASSIVMLSSEYTTVDYISLFLDGAFLVLILHPMSRRWYKYRKSSRA